MDEDYLAAVALVKFINDMLDMYEFVIFSHGTIVDFFNIDENDDFVLDYAELADRNIAKWLRDYDEDGSGDLDADEYM